MAVPEEKPFENMPVGNELSDGVRGEEELSVEEARRYFQSLGQEGKKSRETMLGLSVNEKPLINIKEILAGGTQSVSLEDLAARGFHQVRVIEEARINALINNAVKNVVRAYEEKFSEREMELLAKDAKAEFLQLLERYREMSRVKADLEKSRDELSRELERFKKEMSLHKVERHQRRGEEEVIRFRSWGEFEQKVRSLVAEAVEARIAKFKGEEDTRYIADIDSFRSYLEGVTAEILASHQHMMKVATDTEEKRKVALLEKRIEKLMAALKASEEAIRRMSESHLYSDRGLKLILRKIGLDPDAPDYSRKIGLMRQIYEQNVELRKRVS